MNNKQLSYYKQLIQNPEKFELINQFIPESQVAWLFEESDIVVLPYITATQSGVLSIAYSFGKAVIATDTGSIGDILVHNHNGILIPPKSKTHLSTAITDLLTDNQKRLTIANHAKQYAEINLNWNNIAQQTVSVYHHLEHDKHLSYPAKSSSPKKCSY